MVLQLGCVHVSRALPIPKCVVKRRWKSHEAPATQCTEGAGQSEHISSGAGREGDRGRECRCCGGGPLSIVQGGIMNGLPPPLASATNLGKKSCSHEMFHEVFELFYILLPLSMPATVLDNC